MPSPASNRHPGVEFLSCLALRQHNDGVLFLDLDPALLRPIGEWLAGAVAKRWGERPRLLTLGPWSTDDNLWHSMRLTGKRFESAPGLLVESPSQPPPIILVPNLATAGLPVHRAAVTLIGADVAVSERHGRGERWAPRAHWLAACGRDDTKRLSAHLLDRFPLRIDGRIIRRGDPQSVIDTDLPALLVAATEALDRSGIQHRSAQTVQFTSAAIDRIVELSVPAQGARRDIALGRMSRAAAVLSRQSTVTPDVVDQAATMLGMSIRKDVTDPAASTADPDRTAGSDEGVRTEIQDPRRMSVQFDPGDDAASAFAVGATRGFEESASRPDVSGSLFPDDDADALPEATSLRLPSRRQSLLRQARGQIVGVEPTRQLHDVAVLPTLLQALKFQGVRRALAATESPGSLIISLSDLRRYRRRLAPAAALVLVIDHTCRRTWDWSATLAPYLRWAYTQRAQVTVIEFGHLEAKHELRADRYRATGLLDPRIPGSLERAPGNASPLAYALDLAADEVRHVTRRGRVPVGEVILALITDGRGNVPFDASVRGHVVEAVASRGIADARRPAEAISGLRGVTAVVLAPDSAAYPHLPYDLADAMGGVVMALAQPDNVSSGGGAAIGNG